MTAFDPETGEKLEDDSNTAHEEVFSRLSVDEARRIVMLKHGIVLPEDDPLFVMVTVFNAVLDKSDAAQKKMLEEIVTKFADDLSARLEPITSEALKGQIHAHLAKMTEAGAAIDRAMQEYKRSQFWYRVLSITTIIACLVTVILMTRS